MEPFEGRCKENYLKREQHFMRIRTSRFGEMDVDESRIIEMTGGGILGFEHLKRFVLMTQDEQTPFLWLQSLDDGAVAFVVINSFIAKSDYEPCIADEDTALLGLDKKEDEEVLLLSIVTIRSNPFRVSANLRAPLIINAKKKLARQVVLEEDFPIRFDLALNEPQRDIKAMEESSEKVKTISMTIAL
jgi:flagellar assembly factor FliW